MKIILSVFECNPFQGSEAGLGWSWVYSAMKTKEIGEIWVITTPKNKSINNKKDIAAFLNTETDSGWKKVHFVYVEIPLFNVKINNRVRYIFWQFKILRTIHTLCEHNSIDFIHHATWASMTLPVFLYKEKNAKIIYGPVGGGERIPSQIHLTQPLKYYLIEIIRNLLFDISRISYPSIQMKKHSHRIFVTTLESGSGIPEKYREKCMIFQSIGVYADNVVERKMQSYEKGTCFTILMAARLLSWKGIQIGIEATKKLLNEGKNIRLLICGSGKIENELKKRADGYHQIEFLGNVTHTQMNNLYDEADIFLNCSLHDSGGMVVLEAMSRGLPVMYINCGGPAVIANKVGIEIEPAREDRMIDDISEKISRIMDEPAILSYYEAEGLKKVREEYLNEDKYAKLISLL